MDSKKKCRGYELIEDAITGYKIKPLGDCSEELEKIMAGLPPRRRRYLERRIEGPQSSASS